MAEQKRKGNMSNKDTDYIVRKMTPRDNHAMAELIRYNLKNHGLDIPGTVYFDPALENLCEFYSNSEKRGYYVITDACDNVLGGVGFAEFTLFPDCAELQKLYLADSVKGKGWGYRLISIIEEKMKEAGYKASYLETHHNLKTAMHVYEKSGYARIERPKEVAHGAMTDFFYKELI